MYTFLIFLQHNIQLEKKQTKPQNAAGEQI